MNYKKMAKEILEKVGGESNVINVVSCSTRLRFSLKDVASVNQEEVKRITGVIGVNYQSGQFQVIIGTEVGQVYSEIAKIGNFESDVKKDKKKSGSIGAKILDVVSGSFGPVIPAMTAAGLIKAILALLLTFDPTIKSTESFYLINMIADATYYFMPVMLAFSAAQKMNVSPFLAVAVAVTLLHPNFMALKAQGATMTSLFGLPVRLVAYNASVIPILLSVWFMSYVEKFAEKVSPNVIKFFAKPLIIILITAPVTFIVLGPIGAICGDGLAAAVVFVSTKFSWLAISLLAAFLPWIIMTGMHQSLKPVTLQLLVNPGYDMLILPAMLATNISQAGATFAVLMKTKNKELKSVASTTWVTAFMGITEPAMYGVNLPLKRPMFGVMTGAGIAGLYAGIMGVKAIALATPGIVALPIFIGQTFVHAVITLIIAFTVSFATTWILGFDDSVNQENKMAEHVSQDEKIVSPIEGKIVPLNKVPDETFAQEIMGKGIAIEPANGVVKSPLEGIVAAVFPTKHAIGLRSVNGCEILIHIGINTVRLDGKYFESCVVAGAHVKIGDDLIKFDRVAIQNEGYELITPIVVTNSDEYVDIVSVTTESVKYGDILLELVKK